MSSKLSTKRALAIVLTLFMLIGLVPATMAEQQVWTDTPSLDIDPSVALDQLNEIFIQETPQDPARVRTDTQRADNPPQPVSPNLKLSVSGKRYVVGTTVQLKASISSRNGTPTGSFTFMVNGAAIASGVSAGSGSATVNWTPASKGTATLTAVYSAGSGDAYTGDSVSKQVTVEAPQAPATQNRGYSEPPKTNDPAPITPPTGGDTAPQTRPQDNPAPSLDPQPPQGMESRGVQNDQNNPSTAGTQDQNQPSDGDSGANQPPPQGDLTPINTGSDGTQTSAGDPSTNQSPPQDLNPQGSGGVGQQNDVDLSGGFGAILDAVNDRMQNRQLSQDTLNVQEEVVVPPITEGGQSVGALRLGISGPKTVVPGETIRITVRMTPAEGGAAPSGTIALAGSTGISDISQGEPVDGGFAFTAKVAAAEGGVQIVAVYSGSDYTGNASLYIPHYQENAPEDKKGDPSDVTPVLTLRVGASPSKAMTGDDIMVTVTASVDNEGAAPTGQVSITSDGLSEIPGAVVFAGGVATFSAKAASVEGEFAITATYTGEDYQGVTGAGALTIGDTEQVVDGDPDPAEGGDSDTTGDENQVREGELPPIAMMIVPNQPLNKISMTMDCSPNPVQINQYLTVTVTANTGAGVKPTGTVQLSSSVQGVQFPFAAQAFTNGKATFVSTTTVPLGTGNIELTASYVSAGENDYLANTAVLTAWVGKTVLTASNTTITISPANAVYNRGMFVTPTIAVRFNGNLLTPGVHYTVNPAPGPIMNAGTTLYTIEGFASYSGTLTQSFVVSPKPLNAYGITVGSISDISWANANVPPTPVVRDGLNVLTQNVDFQYQYDADLTTPGPKTLRIVGIGNYTGTATVSYNVVGKSIANPSVTTDPASLGVHQYTGSQVRPAFLVKDGTQVLKEGVHYTVAYPNTWGTGTFYVTIYGKYPYYSDSITRSFQVVSMSTTLTATASGGWNGTPVVLSARVYSTNQGVVSNGSVIFTVNGAHYDASVLNGVATLSPGITGLPAGVHVVTAQYFGLGSGYADSAQITISVNVTQTQPVQPLFQITGGQNGAPLVLVLSYPMQPGAVPPSGNAKFTDGVHTYEQPFTAQGVAALTFPSGSLENGRTYTFWASYDGDQNYPAFPKTARSVTIGQSPHSVPNVILTVQGGQNGTQARITVTVARLPGWPIPTGFVTIRAANNAIQRLMLDPYGQATFLWTNVPYDKCQISAYYEGDANYSGAASNIVTLNEGGGGGNVVGINLTANMNGSSKNATLKATLTSQWWNAQRNRYEQTSGWYNRNQYQGPTGWVNFYANNKLLDTVRLVNGEATMTWHGVPVGSHTILAVYTGDVFFQSSRSSVTLTRRSSGSGGSRTTNTTTPAASGEAITLRDAGGNVVQTFNDLTVDPADGAMLVSTWHEMDFYSFGIPLTKMRQYQNTNGFFDLSTPDVCIRVPFDLLTYLEGYSDYVSLKKLTDSRTELRVTLEKVNRNTLSVDSSALNSIATGDLYRIDLHLYDQNGARYDFKAGQLGSPIMLLMNKMGTVETAVYLDALTQTFVPAGVSTIDSKPALTVDQMGVYGAEPGSK